jgi:hypothetical protein
MANDSRPPVPVRSAVEVICSGCGDVVRPGAGWLALDVHAAMAAEQASAHLHERTGRLMSLDAFMDEAPGCEHWTAWHYRCDPDLDGDSFRYCIEVGQVTTLAGVIGWTAHLMEKTWLSSTDWDDVLRDLANGAPGLLREVA